MYIFDGFDVVLEVQYFDTTIELLIALLETDLVGISAAMRAYNDLTLVPSDER